jgi:hypothetical protein
MKMKSLFFSPILLIGLLLALSACTTPNVYYVSTSGNDANDCLSADHACLTVGAAVTKATPRSQIRIGPGTFSSHIDLTKWLTINGTDVNPSTGTILVADSAAPVVTIENDVQVTLTDMTISGGDTTDLAGPTPPTTFGGSNAIELHGTNLVTQLTAKSVNLVNATYGILSATPSTIYLIDASIFYDNYGVSTTGGRLYVDTLTFFHNGLNDLVNASITIMDHVHDQDSGVNLTDPPSEAAIENYTNGRANGSLQITNSYVGYSPVMGISSTSPGAVSISNTTVEQNGGNGINVLAPAATVTIENNVVQFNRGAGIYISAANTTIDRTAIISNSSTGLGISGIATVTNTSIGFGLQSGISTDGTLTLAYDTVAYNARSGLVLESSSPTTLSNTIIAVNGATNCTGFDPSYHPVLDSASLACNDALTADSLGLSGRHDEAGTIVIPILAGSPAVDHASGSCPAVDQRGYPRPYGAACDVGAYELGAGAHLEVGTPMTETPTLPVLQIVTNTPTGTSTETTTPTVQLAAQVIPTLNAYCRKGPGTAYDQETVLQKGTVYNAIGRNRLNSWWQIQVPGKPNCWVGDANVGRQGPVEQLAIVPPPPLPGTPAKFVNSFVCDIKMKSLAVSLNWAKVPGVTGYRLYRNGSLLTSVAAGTTTYSDNAPLGADLVYEVEALNGYGVAARISTSVPACK